MAVIRVSIEVNRGPLSRKHVALLRRGYHYLLCRVLNYNLRHVLSKSWRLLVWVWGRVTTWWGIVSARICIGVV